MDITVQTKSSEQIVAGIEALDLDPIKFKLTAKEGGQGWTRERADLAENGYRRFLMLLTKYPQESIAPTRDVDEFWHGHILDTLKYAEDCQNVFGQFLHHFPYLGMRDDEDADHRVESARTMRRLYQQEFGEPMPSADDTAFSSRVDAAFSSRVDAAFSSRVDAAFSSRIGDTAFSSVPDAKEADAHALRRPKLDSVAAN
ncbi:MAG: glycine-rich domain-containing protein, partial [Noviherbaspirillum sp.]